MLERNYVPFSLKNPKTSLGLNPRVSLNIGDIYQELGHFPPFRKLSQFNVPKDKENFIIKINNMHVYNQLFVYNLMNL